MERKPDWKVFLNISAALCERSGSVSHGRFDKGTGAALSERQASTGSFYLSTGGCFMFTKTRGLKSRERHIAHYLLLCNSY